MPILLLVGDLELEFLARHLATWYYDRDRSPIGNADSELIAPLKPAWYFDLDKPLLVQQHPCFLLFLLLLLLL